MGYASSVCGQIHAQDVETHQRADALRHGEGQQAEGDAAPPRLGEAVQIDLQPGQKHDVEHAHAAEERHRGVALQQAEPVGAENRSGDEEQHEVGHAQPLREERRKQHHQGDDDEGENRVVDGVEHGVTSWAAKIRDTTSRG